MGNSRRWFRQFRDLRCATFLRVLFSVVILALGRRDDLPRSDWQDLAAAVRLLPNKRLCQDFR